MKLVKKLGLLGVEALAFLVFSSGSLVGQNRYGAVNPYVKKLAEYIMGSTNSMPFESSYGTSNIYRRFITTDTDQYLVVFTDRGFSLEGYNAQHDGIPGWGDEIKLSVNPHYPGECTIIDKNLDGKIDLGGCSQDKRFRDREYIEKVMALLDLLGIR